RGRHARPRGCREPAPPRVRARAPGAAAAAARSPRRRAARAARPCGSRLLLGQRLLDLADLLLEVGLPLGGLAHREFEFEPGLAVLEFGLALRQLGVGDLLPQFALATRQIDLLEVRELAPLDREPAVGHLHRATAALEHQLL